MMLKYIKLKKVSDYKEFTIFVYLHRSFGRFIQIFFSLCRLATGPRSFPTGLFLLLKPDELRSIVFIPIKLIKQANKEGWSRSLAYFVRMKSLYVNNTHYGFNLRSLGKKLGITPACLSFHIKELRKRELVVDHSGNMTFLGLRKMSTLYGSKNIGIPVDHKNQLSLLRAQIIRFNLATQEYNIKKTGIQKCPREVPNDLNERFYSCYAGLSAIGFGKVLGLSPSQGAAIRAKMIQLGILSAKRRYSIVIASGGPFGETTPWGVLRTALIQMKIQGLMPPHAFIKDGSILIERRMELNYLRA